jgi:hypothetical protein
MICHLSPTLLIYTIPLIPLKQVSLMAQQYILHLTLLKQVGNLGSFFNIKHTGKKPENPPEWMSATYKVWYCNPVQVFADLLTNQDFKDKWDPAPLHQYNSSGEHIWCNLMSGNWAWKQYVSSCHI